MRTNLDHAHLGSWEEKGFVIGADLAEQHGLIEPKIGEEIDRVCSSLNRVKGA
jgi:hypothetical protein